MWWFDYPEDKPEQLLDYLKRFKGIKTCAAQNEPKHSEING